MKGQAAVLVIVLIVVGIGLLLMFSGGSGFSFSGFSGPVAGGKALPQIVHSNDVITVADKFISSKAPLNGQKTAIEFIVKNNGDKDIEGVKVKLDPPTGFTYSLSCGDASASGNECTMTLEEGAAEEVVISLTAIEEVDQILPTNVRYYVSYKYSGTREVHMPVVVDRDELPKGQRFFTSSSSLGPLQIEVTTPAARQISSGESAVFAVADIPFRMKFRIDDVGDGGEGNSETVYLRDSQLSIATTDSLLLIYCDKIDETTKALKKTETDLEDGEEVPFEVSCTFEPKATAPTDGVININLKDYEYKIVMSDQFTIIPRKSGETDIEGTAAPTNTQAGDQTQTAATTAAKGANKEACGACIDSGQAYNKETNSCVSVSSAKADDSKYILFKDASKTSNSYPTCESLPAAAEVKSTETTTTSKDKGKFGSNSAFS